MKKANNTEPIIRRSLTDTELKSLSVLEETENVQKACDSVGISRSTFYNIKRGSKTKVEIIKGLIAYANKCNKKLQLA